MTDSALLRLSGLSRPIALRGCADLLEGLPNYFRGWQIAGEPADDKALKAVRPVLDLIRHPRGYRLKAAWIRKPLHRGNEVDIVCALIAELARAFAEDSVDLLCLHGAAAAFAGRLVVFPNRYRAGKSVLSAALAAAGQRLFGDDVLFITEPDDQGMAPGFAPRLRLPLPDNLSPSTRDFVTAHAGPTNEHYLYLDLPDDLLAPHGATAPVGAFVLLERRDSGQAILEPIGRAEVLRQVIWQNFARASAAPRILRRLETLVEQVGCYRLLYHDADSATALLQQRFSRWETPEPRPAARVDAATVGASAPFLILPPGPGQYRQALGIAEHQVDGEQFLADDSGRAIHHLNAVGSAVWRLLAQPMTLDQVADQLHAAFPDVTRDRIHADLTELFESLVAKNLLIAGTPASRAKRRPQRQTGN